jgi:23S rRNA (cytosine1962-C5)-methyltransferase
MNIINYPKIQLKAGRDWTTRRGHPWVFSGAIQNPPISLPPGSLVQVQDVKGELVALGYYNPKTDIAIRTFSNNNFCQIDLDFFKMRLTETWQLRQQGLDLSRTNVFRLVNAEGDFLPGLIADYYAGVVVVQSHTAGIDLLLEAICAALVEVVSPTGILVRNDVSVRSREGLKKEEPKLVFGEVPAQLEVQENGLKFTINPWKGQKTGFYADQRDKRLALTRYAKGETLLNCFSYSAGFSVYASSHNPAIKTTNIDQSAAALDIARQNFALNGQDPIKHEFLATDAFEFLQEHKLRYDTVILDPPAFAKSHRDKAKALSGYTRLNTLGIPLVKAGGILMTCSCSGSVTMEEFAASVAQGAAQAGRRVQILETFEQGLDHPVNIFTPESRYLKVLVCRVLE